MTMRLAKFPLFAALSAALALIVAGCGTNPATGRPMMSLVSPQEEQRTGREMHPQILREFGRYPDERVQAYVTRVGQSLVSRTELPNAQWTFTVLDSPIVNAFALPGGYVYITRGLMTLAQSEAELASVLGHEMGHVTARHAAQRQTAALGAGLLGALVGVLTGSGELAQAGTGTGQALVASYSRDQEFEADDLGIRYTGRTGYDVHAASAFLNRMGDHSRLEAAMMGNPGRVDQYNIMSTHPRTPERVARAAREAQASGASGTRVERDAYLAAIDGMIYGDSAEQGFVRGQRFIHPTMGFAFDAPAGYRLFNRADSVIGQSQNGGILMVDSQPGTGSPARLIERTSQGAAQNIQPTTINGFDAATGTVRSMVNNRPMEMRIVAIRYDQNTVFRFRSVHAGGGQNMAADRAAASFHRISGGEAAGLQPYRVRVVTVQPGDTVASLAGRMPFADFREDRFRILNGMSNADRTLSPGQRVKIIQ
ncbi:MAG: putative zinc metalloprotease, Peptidase family [Alphaproteobacteria bacterium]|nr:putative zinc metalloprotease, Peptidase family [Alphaproteobacteria bacterium]